jgi:hypothetical protein
MAAGSKSQLISSAVPASVEPGAPFTATVVMRNIGPDVWTEAAGYKLGAVGDSTIWNIARVPVPSPTPPNGVSTFTFTAYGPPAPGSYPFKFGMLQEGVNWFGPSTGGSVQVNGTPTPPPPGSNFDVAVDVGDVNSVNLFITGPIPINDTPRQFRAKYVGAVPLRIIKSDIWAGIDAGMTPIDVHVEAILGRTGCVIAKSQLDHYAEPNSSFGNVMVYDFNPGIVLKPGDDIIYYANAFKGANPRPGNFANRLTLWVTR